MRLLTAHNALILISTLIFMLFPLPRQLPTQLRRYGDSSSSSVFCQFFDSRYSADNPQVALWSSPDTTSTSLKCSDHNAGLISLSCTPKQVLLRLCHVHVPCGLNSILVRVAFSKVKPATSKVQASPGGCLKSLIGHYTAVKKKITQNPESRIQVLSIADINCHRSKLLHPPKNT